MIKTVDAIIIGAGVIGTAIAFELVKMGWKTINVDRNTQIGHGSTSGSCAIIRTHYSTFDGTVFAWEAYHYWRDWKEYLGLPAGHDLAKYRETGCLVMKTKTNGYLKKHIENCRLLECPLEEWSPEKIVEKLPIYSLESYAPARAMSDPDFSMPMAPIFPVECSGQRPAMLLIRPFPLKIWQMPPGPMERNFKQARKLSRYCAKMDGLKASVLSMAKKFTHPW